MRSGGVGGSGCEGKRRASVAARAGIGECGCNGKRRRSTRRRWQERRRGGAPTREVGASAGEAAGQSTPAQSS
uniref:Uncharacterized protein n=4 Tax=Oryza TaxID=4527 RepID=Q5VMX3_ORYSJ|nr:hypothetical protein [Oryza sativa Japonica Group]BAD69426.1 hypothetical protein [Oryza sativa Japonica Group]BAX24585.1 hypothetical protein [Oryza sativa Japonica Group]BAX24602.1 hypothetical protein [Oryza sativa Indica Group]BAX24698.1 hypothetical protein [Oryza rufipogon]